MTNKPDLNHMNNEVVACFIARNTFHPKTKVIFTLEVSTLDGRWYLFGGTQKGIIDDLFMEMFKLKPREAIEQWRKWILDASPLAWNEFESAYFQKVGTDNDAERFHFETSEWFYDPQSDYEQDAIDFRKWLDQYYPVDQEIVIPH